MPSITNVPEWMEPCSVCHCYGLACKCPEVQAMREAGKAQPICMHDYSIEDLLVKDDLMLIHGKGRRKLPHSYEKIEINRRIREAEKIGEQIGFNACREMALVEMSKYVYRADQIEAIINLKPEAGK